MSKKTKKPPPKTAAKATTKDITTAKPTSQKATKAKPSIDNVVIDESTVYKALSKSQPLGMAGIAQALGAVEVDAKTGKVSVLPRIGARIRLQLRKLHADNKIEVDGSRGRKLTTYVRR